MQTNEKWIASESKMQTQQGTRHSGMITCKMIKVRNTDILNDLLVSIEDAFAVYILQH